MTKRTFPASTDGKTFRRTSESRVYAFVIVGTPDIDAARARAACTVADKTDISNFRWDTFIAGCAPGAVVAPPTWGGRTTTFSAERIADAQAAIEGGLPAAMARQAVKATERFEQAVAKGYFTPQALAWTSRAGLAQVQIQAARGRGYLNVRALPVEG
jgi:hypothetical protein